MIYCSFIIDGVTFKIETGNDKANKLFKQVHKIIGDKSIPITKGTKVVGHLENGIFHKVDGLQDWNPSRK